MPKLNRDVIRTWLVEHNWTYRRLAEGTIRNAVNGLDPMRPGRIMVICKVTAKYGDGIPYGRLVAGKGGGRG